MKLTRRDAVAALLVSGVAVGSVSILGSRSQDPETVTDLGDHEVATMAALATVLYPSEVSNVAEFVETYVSGRFDGRPDRVVAVEDAIASLDDYCRTFWDEDFVDLPEETRADVPDVMALDETDPAPEGNEHERIRYYLVNELLYALYASPTGGELVGIENPPGHPGGLRSYQRGPNGD